MSVSSTQIDENLFKHRSSAAQWKKGRSRVTNGGLLVGIDGRTVHARRFRDLIQLFVNEVGGNDHVNEFERGLIRQAALLTLRSEQLQAAIVRGEAVNTDDIIRLGSEARRTLDAVAARAARRKPSRGSAPIRERLRGAP